MFLMELLLFLRQVKSKLKEEGSVSNGLNQHDCENDQFLRRVKLYRWFVVVHRGLIASIICLIWEVFDSYGLVV